MDNYRDFALTVGTPLITLYFLYVIALSLIKKVVPRTIYLPEYPMRTKPLGYFISLLYLFLLFILTFTLSIYYDLHIKIW